MKGVPAYTKILTLGSRYTEDALTGEVILQEKVDGSQFGFGINDDGELVFRSHNAPISIDNLPKMFKEGFEYISEKVTKLWESRISIPPDTYFYCEYLQKPKHNTLNYGIIPKNHLVLFDVLENGNFQKRDRLIYYAKLFDIDIIPVLYIGMADLDKIKFYLNTGSYLGNESIEGVVIKNYGQTIMLGGQLYPLFTKYVRETFKERNGQEWKDSKDELGNFLKSFTSEARWQKAIQHLEEEGKLFHEPKDIGELIKIILDDVVAEEAENIADFMYKYYLPKVKSFAIAGFPEWYKEQLLQRIKEV